MIVEADALAGKPQRRDRIHKARCKTSETAVSKGRFRFYFFYPGKLFSPVFQNFLHLVINAQIDKVVGQQLSYQEFRRNIVNFFVSVVRYRRPFHPFYKTEQYHIGFFIRRLFQRFPEEPL